MEDKDKLAQKNIETQLALYEKIDNARGTVAYCIKAVVQNADKILRDNIKCIDNTVPTKDRVWQITLTEQQWETVRVLNAISTDREVDKMHGEYESQIRAYKEILYKLR